MSGGISLATTVIRRMKHMNAENKKGLLLHTCCAPCSPHVIELLQGKFRVSAYFYNPNIHPYEEYQKRLEEMESFCHKVGVELLVGEYEAEEWFRRMEGKEKEKEGGKRCELCYHMRLEKTAHMTQIKGFSYFTTTLTVSPHKKAPIVNQIGRELERHYSVFFYEADFKKQDGFKKSCILAQKYGLYRQNYCGCVYSKRN